MVTLLEYTTNIELVIPEPHYFHMEHFV